MKNEQTKYYIPTAKAIRRMCFSEDFLYCKYSDNENITSFFTNHITQKENDVEKLQREIKMKLLKEAQEAEIALLM